MNKKVKSILQMFLPIILLLSFASVFTACALPEKPKVRVVPKDNIFTTDPTALNYKKVGDTFTVNVTAVDWPSPGVFALSFKLYYDNSILEALSISPNDTSPLLPTGHFMAPGTHWPPGTWKKGGLYIVSEGTGIWQAEGYAALALTLTGDEPGHVGTGTIAQITFKITKEPTAIQPCSCPLELKEVILSDPTPARIPPETYDVENGDYEYAMPPPPKPVLKVTPQTFIWDIKTAEAAGWKFNVTVDIENLDKVWRLVGVQFKLHYDTSLLNTTHDWITQGDFFDPFIPHGKWFETYVEEDYGIIGILILPNATGGWTVFPEGSGTIVNIQFEAIYIPPPSAGCDLTLDEVRLVNDNVEPIDYKELKPGRYDITVAPPPWLSIEPSDKTVSVVGEEFDLTVLINELVAGWRMVGAEFKIRYNLSLFDIVDINEGGFMSHFATLSGTGTWFQNYTEEDPISGYGLVGIMILPNATGEWKGPFPDTTDYGAPGDLAIVRFKVVDWYPELISDIGLDEIMLADTEAARVPYNEAKTAIEGICTIKAIPPIPPGAYLDLFAGNYYNFTAKYAPTPSFAGTGLNSRSDAFAPQAGIKLTALVLWNRDPVMNKPVSYQIFDAKKKLRATNVTFSNEDGFATLLYRIPGWPPSSNPKDEGIFGDWRVRATVDIGGSIANDTLIFRVGWLVEVKVEPDKPAYNKYNITEHLGFTITLTTISMQKRPYYGTIVVYDNLSVPIGVLELKGFEFGLGEYINAAYNTTYEKTLLWYEVNVTTCIQIPRTAFVGMATVVVNMFTARPWDGGVAYCPPGVATFEIVGKK